MSELRCTYCGLSGHTADECKRPRCSFALAVWAAIVGRVMCRGRCDWRHEANVYSRHGEYGRYRCSRCRKSRRGRTVYL